MVFTKHLKIDPKKQMEQIAEYSMYFLKNMLNNRITTYNNTINQFFSFYLNLILHEVTFLIAKKHIFIRKRNMLFQIKIQMADEPKKISIRNSEYFSK